MEMHGNTSKKQEKHKMAISIGGGVGAVVVWGGAVAIATLASVSAIKLRRRKPTNKSHPPPPIPTDQSNELEKDEASKGLRALLQQSSPPLHHHHQSSDGTTNMGVIQIDSTPLDKNPVLDISGQKENPTYKDILLSDNSKPESSPLLLIDHGYGVNGQDFSLPVRVSPSLLNPENDVNKNIESIEDLPAVEVIEDTMEHEAPHAGQIAVKDNPKMQLTEKEEEDDDDDDDENIVQEKGEDAVETAQVDQIEEDTNENDNEEDIAEKGEESSEGTGDSSMESNSDAIWPVESMQEFSLEIKELKMEDQKLEEKTEEDGTLKTEEHGCQNSIQGSSSSIYLDGHETTLIKRDPQHMLKLINQPTNSSNLRIWIWLLPVLVVVVPLLLSLTQIVKLCLIILFIMILSKFHILEKLS